jgi:hypothetical protein
VLAFNMRPVSARAVALARGVPLLVLAVVTLLFQDSMVHPKANHLGTRPMVVGRGAWSQRLRAGKGARKHLVTKRSISAAARERASCAQARSIDVRQGFQAASAVALSSPALI